MARWVGAQGQLKLAKSANTSDYDVTHRQPQTQIKNFFSMEIRFAESVDGLNTSLVLSPDELWVK